MHNFLPSQPDLNWWNPAVHQAFSGDPAVLVRPWRGGFPVSTSPRALQGRQQLRDDPPAPDGELVRGRFRPGPGVQREPAGVARGVPGLAEDRRELPGAPGAAAVRPGSVTWNALAAFHGHGDELQLTFNLPFIFSPFHRGSLWPPWWPSPWPSCPPGSARSGPRPTTTSADSRPAGVWRGTSVRSGWVCWCCPPCPALSSLYYGDELGMTDVDVPAELVRDKMRAEAGAQGEPGPVPDSHAVGLLTVRGVHRRRCPAVAAVRQRRRGFRCGTASGSIVHPAPVPATCWRCGRKAFAGQLASYEQLAAPAWGVGL